MKLPDSIYKILQNARSRRSAALALNGVFLLAALLICGYLVANSYSYFFLDARKFASPYAVGLLLAAGYILYRYFINGAFSRLSDDQTALLIEQNHSTLKNYLVNACQLNRLLNSPRGNQETSSGFIKELAVQTESRVDAVQSLKVADAGQLKKNRNLFLVSLTVLAVAVLAAPDFISKGYKNFISNQNPNTQAKSQNSSGKSVSPPPLPAYRIEELSLAYNYPAYTGLPQKTVHPSDGRVLALPGTEVLIKVKTNLPLSKASLVLNRDAEYSTRQTDPQAFEGQFLNQQPGFYQFQIQSPDRQTVLLPEKYPIVMDKDQTPRIVLFVLNPKPVYYADHKIELSFEGSDDFGIKRVDLIADVNGKLHKIPVKSVKDQTTMLQENFSWNLAPLNLGPADTVQYYFEIQDNDNILGPNVGQSEVISFSIFDAQKEREDLIALQDELVERMIALLSHTLVGDATHFQGPPPGVAVLKTFITRSADQLIEIINLAQAIQTQAKNIPSFPQSYRTLLTNIVNGLNKIREQQITALDQLNREEGRTRPISFGLPPAAAINNRLIAHLEKDIIFLVKISNRQKMDQVMDMKKDLNQLAEELKKAFEKAKNQKSEFNRQDFKAKLEKLKETLGKIMEQLGRQTQALPDEFLNPEAFKRMDLENLDASLEKLMDLVNQGKMEEALNEMEELSKELQTLSSQLNQADSDMDELVDMKTMEKLENSLEEIRGLEKAQKNLLEETMKINQSLRQAQSREFEDSLKEFFDSLRKDVEQILGILNSDREFLNSHRVMKIFHALLAKEAALNSAINDLRQKTVDAEKSDSLEKSFQTLNEARKESATIHAELDALRVFMAHRFQEGLPQLFERYNALEEFTRMQDLPEFNSLFKNTYPEILRWNNRLRMSHNTREDVAGRLNQDLRDIAALNTEISKKLGTMKRNLDQSLQALVGPKDVEKMKALSEQQKNLGAKTKDLAEDFFKMTRENPMLTQELGLKMGGGSRHMQQAEKNLNQQKVSESIQSENRALEKLAETRDLLEQMKNAQNQNGGQARQQSSIQLGTGRGKDQRLGGSARMQREKVQLPSEDQYQVPGEFRNDILKAMKNSFPRKYERLVGEYYKELVK